MNIDRRTLIAGFSSLAAASALGPLPARAALNGFRPAGPGRVDHSAFDALLKGHSGPTPQAYNRVDYQCR